MIIAILQVQTDLRTSIFVEAHEIVADRSTQSVWIIDSEEIVSEIHGLAGRYGKSHLYSASRLD